MSMRNIIIDCDPGLDDAVALFLAFAASDRRPVLGVTTVAGNVPLKLTARNACIIRELARRPHVPVYAGCPRPILRAPVTAEDFHGENGLAGLFAFEPEASVHGDHAVSYLIDTLRSAPDPITLVITGPMTNAALALVQAPDIAGKLEQIVIMGGADTEGGNITPTAEFNIYADPHAAEIVYSCGAPIVALSLDVTHQLRSRPERIAAIRAGRSASSGHVADLLEASNKLEFNANQADSAPLHDPSTIAYLLAPHLFEARPCTVRVDTNEGETFGQTRVTHDPAGHVKWVTKVDADGVFALIAETLDFLP